MTDGTTRVVVVGAGHGGTATAALLRQHGFSGHLTMVGAERHVPYHRPPLSKSSTSEGHAPIELLRPAQFFEEQDIDLRLGASALKLDTDAHQVHLDGGEHLDADVLVLACGARARRIPVVGADLPGVHSLRTLDDAHALRTGMTPGAHLVIVGGGYIGLEVAAMARQRGMEVTLVEAAERVLGRSAGLDMAAWLTERHRQRGTRIELGGSVERFVEGDDGHLSGVGLTDGRDIPCDLAVVGVGAEPCDDLAKAAGLTCDDGVLVDEHAATSAPGVYAVGDMTRRPIPPYRGLHRLESIPSTTEQTRQATAAILGQPAPRPEVPWFWSDQFHLKLQIAGLPSLSESSVVRGEPTDDRFAVFHFDAAGRVLAVEAANAAGEFMAGKKWIAAGAQVDPAALADPATSLRAITVKER